MTSRPSFANPSLMRPDDMKPLADLNEQEVILLLPQITPSRWHDAFKAAKLTGAMLNSVAELNDITKYNIKFKRLEFESFMNRLAVYKTSGVPLLILVEASPVKSSMNNATAVRATSESVAVRVDAWKTKLSQKNPRGRSKSPPAPPKYATMGSKTPTASPRTGGKSPISRPEKESVPKVRGGAPASDKAADGEEEDAPRPEPYTPPPESASMKRITRRLSLRKITIFEKKAAEHELVIISVADRENLLKACEEGDNPFIQAQINENRFDGLSRHANGQTTVMLAAAAGFAETVTLLLQQSGVDSIINSKDKDGATALMLAAERGRGEVLEVLLSHPLIDPSVRNKEGRTAIMYAVRHETSIKILMKNKNVDINVKDHNEKTALMLAIQGNHSFTVQSLLENPDIEINEKDMNGRTALMYACEAGAVSILDLILKAEPKRPLAINMRDKNGHSALYLAAKGGHITVVQMLLQRKDIDVNSADGRACTALGTAIEENHTDVAALLVQQPGIETANALTFASKLNRDVFQQIILTVATAADVNARDQNGNTALIVAANEGKKETVSMLLQQNTIAVNAQDKHGNTPLMLATKKNKKDIVEMLLSHPHINPNIQDRHGTTALMTASRKGKESIVEMLINHRSTNVNLQDANNYTALIIATGEGNASVVKILLTHPLIDVNIKDKDGTTALMLASMQGKKEIVDLLLQHDAIDPNMQDKYLGRTALMSAAVIGNVDVVDSLLSHPLVDVNVKDAYHDDTALLLALRNDHPDVIKSLLCHPFIDLNVKAKDEHTVLSLASKDGMISIVRLLLSNPTFIFDYNDVYHRYTAAVGWKCSKVYENIIELLLNDDVDADFDKLPDDDENDDPLLISAVRGRHKDLVQLLLIQPNIDCNFPDKYGRTPLMVAAREGFKDIVELLVQESSVDLNAVDSGGCTALIGALLNKKENVARFLASLPDIDVSIEDNEGRTAASIAKEHGFRQIINIL